ncbi:hypothetical protein PVK06_030507 [Gossypium arboreum]|uniref:Uncharacterized protein n=1 Tax=Gossypium arboreum TaxID=29729 RepID=A0ABR0NP09_GOSAR|nr:hypothetical protein PVK06_030507 [Gossypium arboreum]
MSRGKEFTKAMSVIDSLIELIPKNDKLEFSKPKEKGNYKRDEETHVKNNGGNGGNGKPHNGKLNSNNKSEKFDTMLLML